MRKAMIGLLMVVVLGLIAAGVWHVWQQQQASRNWPSVPGEIQSAQVVESDDGSNNGEGSRRFTVELVYSYSVAGVALRGTRIRIVAAGHRDAAAAQAELLRYPVGARVEVFYDPADPHSSVLQTGS